MSKKISDEEFARFFRELGAAKTALNLSMDVRTVYRRRRAIEKQTGELLVSPNTIQADKPSRNIRKMVDYPDGVCLVGSDAHYWDEVSTAHLAFLDLCKKLKPKMIILNGDMLDGASISRHAPNSWQDVQHIPELAEEMVYCQARLAEIKEAAPKARRFWPIGNHDARFEMKLAAEARQYVGVPGFSLKDHFPDWQPCASVWINDNVVVKHRWKGGVHASFNNPAGAGKSMVTGHTHQQRVTPFVDYNGVRWGVECGTMAEPYGSQFVYTEDNPRQHISGFIVLTFRNGVMMTPEPVRVIEPGVYEFRGEWRNV